MPINLALESIDVLTLPYTILPFESIYELKITKFQQEYTVLYRFGKTYINLPKILILIPMLPILVPPLSPHTKSHFKTIGSIKIMKFKSLFMRVNSNRKEFSTLQPLIPMVSKVQNLSNPTQNYHINSMEALNHWNSISFYHEQCMNSANRNVLPW